MGIFGTDQSWALPTRTNWTCKRMRNIMRTWCERFVWTSESRPTSSTRNLWSIIRQRPNIVRFFFGEYKGYWRWCLDYSFYCSSVWTGKAFGQWSPIAAEITIANHCQNNNRHNDCQSPPIWTIKIWRGGREFTSTILSQKEFASCPKIKIWKTIFYISFFQH